MKKNKELFSTDFNMSVDEYKKMVRQLPSFYWKNVIMRSLFLIFVFLIFSIIYKSSIITSVIVSLIIIVVMMIFCKVKLDFLAEVNYRFYNRKGLFDKVIHISFYEKYFISSSDGNDLKVEYDSIDKIVETKSNFYIYFNNMLSVIKKNDDVDIEFIRNINRDVLIRESDKNKKTFLDKEICSKTMKLLMIVSILSFVGAVITIRMISNSIPEFLITEKMYVFWFWLPIPVITICFGYYCKRRDIDTKNSLKIGWIVSILLVIFGGFSAVMPVGRIQYKDVKEYEDVLNIELSKDGDFVQNSYETYFDLDKKNVVVVEGWFSDERMVEDLEEKIVSSENWFELSKGIELVEMLIPYQMKNVICDNCYVVVYNDDLKEYNRYPSEKGKYRFIVGLYNLDSNVLEIDSFDMEV